MSAAELEARSNRFSMTRRLFQAHNMNFTYFPKNESDYTHLQYYVDGCSSVHLLSILMDEALALDRPARILGVIQKIILERCLTNGWLLGLPLPLAPVVTEDTDIDTDSGDERYIPPVRTE